MTLNVLWEKLRKRNKNDYRQFRFCIVFAAALISSYLMLIKSPLIEGALPEGGDSGKIVFLILGIAVTGCTVFVWYAVRLFLRYKSREIGIFLALGAERSMLGKALCAEMIKMTACCAMEGILSGAAGSFIIGKLLETVTRRYQEDAFAFTVSGAIFSLLYGIVLVLLILALTVKAMRRANIMDVIYEQRKQEPLRKNVTKKYAFCGAVLVAAGIFLGYGLNQIAANLFGIFLGGWVNVFYLLAVIGLYQLLVYSVSCRQKGRNPQKYYNNLLYYGMMKFQGASVVRNMLVITLLLMGGLYALFYMPIMMSGSVSIVYEDEYSYRYLNDAGELTRRELETIAEETGTELLNYREGEFIRVTGSGIDRDADDSGRFIEDYYTDYAEYDCTSAAQYEKMTGIRLDIPKGGYYLIQLPDAKETTWFRFDDMDQLYAAREDIYLPMKYLGNTEYSSLVITPDNGFGHGSRFVLNDGDYERLKDGLPEQKLETQVLFDTVDSDGEILFAKKVFKEFTLRMSEDMDVKEYYNLLKEERSAEAEKSEMKGAFVNPENPLAERDWQYNPLLAPLREQQNVMGSAVRYLLFVYVAVICFAAAGISGYTRSQSVGIANRQFFEDMKKLGADRAYRIQIMKKQIRKIYVLPTALGVGLILGYSILILYMNDGVIKPYEVTVVGILVLLSTIIAGLQYILYRKSLKTAGRMLKFE